MRTIKKKSSDKKNLFRMPADSDLCGWINSSSSRTKRRGRRYAKVKYTLHKTMYKSSFFIVPSMYLCISFKLDLLRIGIALFLHTQIIKYNLFLFYTSIELFPVEDFFTPNFTLKPDFRQISSFSIKKKEKSCPSKKLWIREDILTISQQCQKLVRSSNSDVLKGDQFFKGIIAWATRMGWL